MAAGIQRPFMLLVVAAAFAAAAAAVADADPEAWLLSAMAPMTRNWRRGELWWRGEREIVSRGFWRGEVREEGDELWRCGEK